MDANLYYIFGGLVAAIIAFVFIRGARDKVVDLSQTWSMLRKRFGVSNEQFDSLSDSSGVLGPMRVFDDEYVGTAFAVPQGVIFRQLFLKSYELILFPWSEIQNFKIEEGAKCCATFSFDRSSGLPVSIQIPWRAGLTGQAASFGHVPD
jgi:hypothetical protein